MTINGASRKRFVNEDESSKDWAWLDDEEEEDDDDVFGVAIRLGTYVTLFAAAATSKTEPFPYS